MKKKQQAKDWTKIESYIGLSPEEICQTVHTCGHMLAFGDDKWAVEIVKTFDGEMGEESGVAAMCCALFIKKHGAAKSAKYATEMYRKIAQELNRDDLRNAVIQLEYMVCFVDHGYKMDLEWPMKFPFDSVSHRAGLANVLLGLSMRGLIDDGSTTSLVAANGIYNFLEDGMKRAEARKKKVSDCVKAG